ncbi:hypothetical protein PEBR_14553 [Penicillium brasilianum]|uniref:Uncharacterized protein n=1 Tax=Penicillium brasilianum TaxID=104259 RepID=A0A1S9RR77_PENBI|nr:hypothetical protein PEBR_14553 [Penicillium brasilianum]
MKRRQLLAYYKDHSDKISKYVDVAVSKAVPVPQLPVNIELQSEHQQRPPTISTQWTQDTTVENDEDWNYHVYSDLRPYICTFGGCVKENQLYDSFTEWSAHERQFHRREWFCTLCPYTSADNCALISLVADHHGDIPEEQRQEMANQSKPSTLAQQCPLCTKPPISDSSRFQKRLARHLQQLALFVLPRIETDDEESALHGEESDESRQALMMDVEDRDSLGSISIVSKVSFAPSSTPGLHSPVDDGLLDVISVEMVTDTSEGIADGPDIIEGIGSMENHPYDPWKTEADAIAALDYSRTNLGPEHRDTIACMDYIANLYAEKGRFRDLEPHLEELLTVKRKILGPEYHSTLKSMSQKGQILYEQARYDEAKEVLVWVVQAWRRHLGTVSSFALDSMCGLVKKYTEMGRFDESDELSLQSIEESKQVFGEDHPNTLWVIRAQATNNFRKGDYVKAEKLLLQIVEASEKNHDAQLYQKLGNWVRADLVQVYFARGEPERAGKYMKRILESMETLKLAHHHKIAITGLIGSVYYHERRFDEAEALFADGMESATQLFGTTTNAFRPLLGLKLAKVYYMKERIGEARQLMAECAEDLLRSMGPQHPWTIEAFKALQE